MAVISAKTIITSISLFHITLGFFFLTNPDTVNNHNLVWIIGESMGMPHARGFDAQSPPLAFLSAILAFLGTSDLVSLSMPEDMSLLYYWGTQAPLRTSFAFAALIYVYFSGPSSPIYAGTKRPSSPSYGSHPSIHTSKYRPSKWGGDGLKNRLFFAFMFLELISWFWLWATLREERIEHARKMRVELEKKERDNE